MRFGISGNIEKRELPEVLAQIVNRFMKEGVQFVLHDVLASVIRKRIDSKTLRGVSLANERSLAKACDIVISLGGDGTILRTARLVGQVGTPIIGINLGKLGFLAEVSVEELDECLSELLRGEYVVEERTMLYAKSKKLPQAYHALNDIVVDRAMSARMISIATYVNGAYLSTYSGDGIIVSTPTGSTGYALSNGGPIVTPSTHSIMISPICPHTLTARPVLVPDDSVVDLRITTAPGKIHITADGQPVSLLKAPIDVRVQKAPFVTRLVRRKKATYYDVLRKKLHWGKDLRATKDNTA
ncbi:MAG: NAD(+)/NADH kinase [Ignavibacteriales bacterium]|nr:NAD(+)/NADH kinase [Ignavibacteriales bacterium]